MCGESVPQVAENIDCHYQALDGEPFLKIQIIQFIMSPEQKWNNNFQYK